MYYAIFCPTLNKDFNNNNNNNNNNNKTSMAEFLSSEAGKLASACEKDFTIDVLLLKKLQEAKLKAS